MQSIWLLVVVFFLIVLIFPIFIKAYASFDVINNVGTISFYIFFIKVICYKTRLGKSGIIFYNSAKENDIPIKLSKRKVRFLEQLAVQLKQKIILKNLTVYSNIGAVDAYNSAILAGLAQIIISAVFARINNIKKYAVLKHINNVNYNGTRFIIATTSKIIITSFDIIYSFIMSLVIIKRSEKYINA